MVHIKICQAIIDIDVINMLKEQCCKIQYVSCKPIRSCYFDENDGELFCDVAFVASLNTIWPNGRPKPHMKNSGIRLMSLSMGHFSIERRKTKTKVITLANHTRGR